MAAKYPDREDEKRRLEEMLKMMPERKKAVFQRTKEADEELLKIREEEMAVHKTLQEIRAEEIERDQRERYEARLHVELKELRQKYEALKIENAELKKRQRGLSVDSSVIKELEALRAQNAEQSSSLRKLRDAMQRITSYSKTQQKRVASLEDENAALRQISAETQQRQLNELQPSSTSTKQRQQQQQQHRKGNAGC